MSNLSVFKQDGLEILIDTQTGESFCTQASYVRMSGANKSTISMRMKGVQHGEIKSAEINTPGGIQGVQLIPARLAYKWALKDNVVLAEKMGECGATVFFHKLAGYEIKSTAVDVQPKSQAEMFLLVAQQMVEQERRTKELESRLAQIEAVRDEAIALLDEVEAPIIEAEELTTRTKLNRLVRDYSAATSIHYQEVWRRLYREFRDRYHIDLKTRAKNLPKKFSTLDVCEQLGKIEELYAVAFELLKA